MHTLGYAYILSDGDFFISTVLYVRTVQPDFSNHTCNVHNFALHWLAAYSGSHGEGIIGLNSFSRGILGKIYIKSPLASPKNGYDTHLTYW